MRGGTVKNKKFYDIRYKGKPIRYEVKNIFHYNARRQYFGIIVKVDEKNIKSLIPMTFHNSQFKNITKKQEKKFRSSATTFSEFVSNQPKDIQLIIKGSPSEILPRCKLSKF